MTDRELLELVLQKVESMEVEQKSTKEDIRGINKRLDKMDERLDSMDKRFDSMDERLDSMDKRFNSMDERLDSMDKRFDSIEDKVDVANYKADRNHRTIEDLKFDIKGSEREVRRDIRKLQDAQETLVVVLEGHGILPKAQ